MSAQSSRSSEQQSELEDNTNRWIPTSHKEKPKPFWRWRSIGWTRLSGITRISGAGSRVPLTSTDGRESFLLDVRRARIDLAKGTYQNRGRQVVVLARLDFGGGPHRNPDGEEIGSTHLHLYREGYGDKWAYQVPATHFSHLSDPWLTLGDFMRFCNGVEPPNIRRGLFT